MAWRLDEAVEHGLIDNAVEGTTTGKIWLKGRDEPLILSLNGDCWRDLAGTTLEFENLQPRELAEISELDTDQTGIVGDITASRKAKVPTLSEEQIIEYERQGREVPYQWQNILYLEWFSEINGRVLIEAAGYRMQISERLWEMDEDLEEAQKLANLSTMRDFMTQMIRRAEPSEYSKRPGILGRKGELNEFEWEERLKESDRLTEAYQEVLEKYIEDPDSEQKEAFVMGWDGLLGAMAERDECSDERDDDFGDEDEDDDLANDWQFADYEDDEEDQPEDGGTEEDWLVEGHPLQAGSREIALRALELVSGEDHPDTPGQRLVSNLMQISAKLAGVLSAQGYQPEAGFVLAVLKRCLNWINEAVGACGELLASDDDPDQKAALEHLRNDIFALRNGVIELRRELKQN